MYGWVWKGKYVPRRGPFYAHLPPEVYKKSRLERDRHSDIRLAKFGDVGALPSVAVAIQVVDAVADSTLRKQKAPTAVDGCRGFFGVGVPGIEPGTSSV